MPELPEVEALTRFLNEKTAGETIERAELAAISALKTFAPPLDTVVGRRVAGWGRRGKYLCLDLDQGWVVVHLARAGWVQWRDKLTPSRAKPGRGPLALRVGLASGTGFDVTEQGTEKHLAIWVVGDPAEVEGVARLGPDPLAPGFDRASFRAALQGHNGQIKGVLTDQSILAGVGNAYSDEALHVARLSPFKPAGKLTEEETDRLFEGLVGVLSDALERSLGLPASGLKGEKKTAMRVHGRTGLACPVCGDTVREVSFVSKSMQYCPTCQTGGKPLADRRLSRLLK